MPLRRTWLLWVLLALAPFGRIAWAQTSSGIARRIQWGSTLPAKCSPNTGDVFFLTSAGPTGILKVCTATDTWTTAGGGATGATGPSGPAGGPTGATGPSGPSGSAGPSGPSGAAGSAGATGVTGATGAAGSAGATGATGPSGSVGPSGAGATGPSGLTGATGATGPSGSTVWQITTTQLDAAAVKALSTTPVVLVGGQGSNTVITIDQVWFENAPGATPFNCASGNTYITFGTASVTSYFSLIDIAAMNYARALFQGTLTAASGQLTDNTGDMPVNLDLVLKTAGDCNRGSIATSAVNNGGLGYLATNTGTIAFVQKPQLHWN